MRNLWIAALILALTPSLGAAQPMREGMRGEMKGGPPMRMMEELNLTGDQQEKIMVLRRDTRKEMIRLRSEIQLKMIDFQEELHKESPDQARLDALVGQIADLKAGIEKIRLTTQIKMTKILTPEQKRKMLNLMGDAMMSGWSDHRMGGGPRRHGGGSRR